MATSLLNKVRTAVLGNLHALLDEVANTPEAYKQRIRDLEKALADLRAAHDEAEGNCTGLKRQITQATSANAQKQADIDLLLGDDDPSNDDAALELQVDLDEANTRIVVLNTLLESAQTDKAQLDTAIDQLEDKHREMVAGLQRITLMSAASKAKDRASSAAENAVEASQGAGSIDSIEARIQADADRANARFGRVIGQLGNDSDPENAAKLARAKAALAARRAQITNAAKSEAGTPA